MRAESPLQTGDDTRFVRLLVAVGRSEFRQMPSSPASVEEAVVQVGVVAIAGAEPIEGEIEAADRREGVGPVQRPHSSMWAIERYKGHVCCELCNHPTRHDRIAQDEVSSEHEHQPMLGHFETVLTAYDTADLLELDQPPPLIWHGSELLANDPLRGVGGTVVYDDDFPLDTVQMLAEDSIQSRLDGVGMVIGVEKERDALRGACVGRNGHRPDPFGGKVKPGGASSSRES